MPMPPGFHAKNESKCARRDIRVVIFSGVPGGMTGRPTRMLTLCEALREQGFVVSLMGDPDDQVVVEAARRRFDILAVKRDSMLSTRNKQLLDARALIKGRVALKILINNIKVARLIKQWRADLFWVGSAKAVALAGLGALMSRRPMIWDVDAELRSRGILRVLYSFGVRFSVATVFQYRRASENIFGLELASKYAKKMHVLTPGIDLSKLKDGLDRRLAQPRKNKRIVMLQVGTICERKNQKFSIACLDALKRNGSANNTELWLAGGVHEQEYKEEIVEMAESEGILDRIRFLGWCQDIPALLAQADILLMPSLDEGVPNALQEAMYIGVPAISSNVGGIPDICEHGKTGWVISLEEQQVWVETLERLIRDPVLRTRVGKAASLYAARHFQRDIWGSSYASVIRQAVPDVSDNNSNEATL